jgi:hypothetical protein
LGASLTGSSEERTGAALDQSQAARSIQTAWRGYKARRVVEQLKKAQKAAETTVIEKERVDEQNLEPLRDDLEDAQAAVAGGVYKLNTLSIAHKKYVKTAKQVQADLKAAMEAANELLKNSAATAAEKHQAHSLLKELQEQQCSIQEKQPPLLARSIASTRFAEAARLMQDVSNRIAHMHNHGFDEYLQEEKGDRKQAYANATRLQELLLWHPGLYDKIKQDGEQQRWYADYATAMASNADIDAFLAQVASQEAIVQAHAQRKSAHAIALHHTQEDQGPVESTTSSYDRTVSGDTLAAANDGGDDDQIIVLEKAIQQIDEYRQAADHYIRLARNAEKHFNFASSLYYDPDKEREERKADAYKYLEAALDGQKQIVSFLVEQKAEKQRVKVERRKLEELQMQLAEAHSIEKPYFPRPALQQMQELIDEFTNEREWFKERTAETARAGGQRVKNACFLSRGDRKTLQEKVARWNQLIAEYPEIYEQTKKSIEANKKLLSSHLRNVDLVTPEDMQLIAAIAEADGEDRLWELVEAKKAVIAAEKALSETVEDQQALEVRAIGSTPQQILENKHDQATTNGTTAPKPPSDKAVDEAKETNIVELINKRERLVEEVAPLHEAIKAIQEQRQKTYKRAGAGIGIAVSSLSAISSLPVAYALTHHVVKRHLSHRMQARQLRIGRYLDGARQRERLLLVQA